MATATQLPPALVDVAGQQHGIVTRQQLLDFGISRDVLVQRLRADRWQRIYPGTYALFSGQVPRSAQLWAAVLAAGRGGTLSHQSAAEAWGLSDGACSPSIHVTVPVDRRVRSRRGLTIHYAHRLSTSRHPARTLPMTRVEDTVLDLIDRAETVEDVATWVTRACQRRLTNPDRLRRALDSRKKIRWRKLLEDMLTEVDEGSQSPLELAYVQRVERPHGLPKARRQRHKGVGNRTQWIDEDYEEYDVRVELDGRIGHVEEGALRDHERDNASAEERKVTLRYGWSGTYGRSCHVAAQIARVMRSRGWLDSPRRCGPGCVVEP